MIPNYPTAPLGVSQGGSMETEQGRISDVGKLYMRGLFETVQILHRATSPNRP
jgi:hypothetical protein